MEDEIIKIKFAEVAAALKDTNQPFPARLLRGLSDLSLRDLREFSAIWPEIPLSRKQSLLEDLEDLSERDTLVCFDEIAKSVVLDENPVVRVLAIRLLWECEDARIIPGITDLMLSDPDEAVRATAASLLGRFVYLGELEQIPDVFTIPMVKNLLEVVSSEDLAQVRMRALESLGYSGNSKVPALIKSAYHSNDNMWVASALCAMGRSADEQWTDLVLEKLDSGDSEVQFEAIRAAGELEIASALEQLFTIVEESDSDDENRLAGIWSLSQIGGPEVKDKLKELLEDSESDEEAEWIEKALENLELGGSPESMDFLNYKPESDSDDEDEDDETSDEDDFEEDEFEDGDDEDLDDLEDFAEDDEEE